MDYYENSLKDLAMTLFNNDMEDVSKRYNERIKLIESLAKEHPQLLNENLYNELFCDWSKNNTNNVKNNNNNNNTQDVYDIKLERKAIKVFKQSHNTRDSYLKRACIPISVVSSLYIFAFICRDKKTIEEENMNNFIESGGKLYSDWLKKKNIDYNKMDINLLPLPTVLDVLKLRDCQYMMQYFDLEEYGGMVHQNAIHQKVTLHNTLSEMNEERETINNNNNNNNIICDKGGIFSLLNLFDYLKNRVKSSSNTGTIIPLHGLSMVLDVHHNYTISLLFQYNTDNERYFIYFFDSHGKGFIGESNDQYVDWVRFTTNIDAFDYIVRKFNIKNPQHYHNNNNNNTFHNQGGIQEDFQESYGYSATVFVPNSKILNKI